MDRPYRHGPDRIIPCLVDAASVRTVIDPYMTVLSRNIDSAFPHKQAIRGKVQP
jgi:hypothetical protein